MDWHMNGTALAMDCHLAGTGLASDLDGLALE